MWQRGIFAVCLLQIAISISAESYYTVIGPGVIHPEHKYSVAVAVHDTTKASQLKVGIIGPSFKEHKVVQLNTADEVKLVDFDIPDLQSGTYNLTVEGISGIEFYNTTKLQYERFEPYVMLQTDKGAYKPGDTVQFRALFFDENLKPFSIKKSTLLWIENNKRNRVKEFKNLEVIKGVYTGRFQLSEFAALGTWRIIVQTKEQNSDTKSHDYYSNYDNSVKFKVEKYVLPKYEVKAEATKDVSVLDGDMQVVVRANYTYGKPVNGKTTLILEVRTWYADNLPRIIKVADMVNGKSKIDLNVKQYDGLIHKENPASLKILATVEEDFTGVKLNATTQSILYPYRYKMICKTKSLCRNYNADKEHEVVYEILHVDKSKVEDTRTTVRLIYTEKFTETWEHERQRKQGKVQNATLPEKMQSYVFEGHLNASSMVTFKVTLPDLYDLDGYFHNFKTEIKFAEQKTEMQTIKPYRQPKEKYIQTTYEEPKDYFKIIPQYPDGKDEPAYYYRKFNVGEETKFLVNSSEPFNYLVYTVTGRGNVLKVERVELAEPVKVYNLTFKATLLMAPYSQIYVHFIGDNHYYYAEVNFAVEFEYENKIEIVVPEQVKAGENVPLQIKTAPNSFVGLLGVDQSILWHEKNNDIDGDRLHWKLGIYGTQTPYQGGYSYYPGEYSGVVTLTNAKYFYNWTKPTNYYDATSSYPFPIYQRGEAPGPPGAMQVMAYSSKRRYPGSSGVAPAASHSPSNPVIRSNFAETWIFDHIENTESENTTWYKQIPDTITSWVIKAFAMNYEKGFAVTKEPSYVKTFQTFFISIRLPYSVKRGEVISVPALVFNYLDKDLDVEVTFDNSDKEFEFTEVTNEVIDLPSRTKTVHVPANSARGVSFMIRPRIIGNTLLKLKAISALAGDAIHKTLKVVPEGITEYANRVYFVNLKDNSDFETKFELELPNEIVPGSEHAEFSVIGDLLGPVIHNLDSLVRLPTGCGEQTMSRFVPNYLALRYLKGINRLTPAVEARIRRNLEQGYQNILHFRHLDGSFSSFGPGFTIDHRPINGSTWLTAYVVRFLQEAREYLELDGAVIHAGLKYLKERQASNGSFTESHTNYFFRSQVNEVALTSSVLLAFLASDPKALYSPQIEAGLNFILGNIEKTTDIRAKALAVYALKQANHKSATKHLTALKALAKSDAESTWWTTATKEDTKDSPYFKTWRWPNSQEVEVTSYVLLSLLNEETETVDSVLPIVKWLVAQRNSFGGFASTQDTIVGLQALIKFAEKSGYEPAEMHIDFTSTGKERSKTDSFDVNAENALLMQTQELPDLSRSIEFQAEGKGAALLQVSYQYNIFEKEKSPSFALNTVINRETPAHKLEMDVCVEYIGTGSESNMALLEVSLPSGYVAEEEIVKDLSKIDRVRHIEFKKSGTNIVVYFEGLLKDDVKCLTIEAFKSFAVALQKPVPIVIYDYYDTTKKANTYYEVSSKLCEICDRDEEKCNEVCN